MARFLVFCFFILIAAPATAQNQQDCSRNFSGKIFSKSVVHSIKWQVFRRIKRLRGFLPANKEAIVKAIKESMLKDLQVQAFAQQLSHLSQRTPTSVLFFSPEENSHCVWLFSSTGDVYAGTTKPWKTFTLQRAFSRLDVSMTGLSLVRSARQTRTGKCIKPAQKFVQPSRSSSEMNFRLLRVNRALKKLRKSLIPPNIFAQLTATKDSRLIIIPANGRGMVPFAALPLGDGHFIDKFSILLTPAITDLVRKEDWVIDKKAFIQKLTSHLVSKYGRRNRRSHSRRRAKIARWLADRRRRSAIARRRAEPLRTIPLPPANKKKLPPPSKKTVGTVLYIPPPGRNPLFSSSNDKTTSGRIRSQERSSRAQRMIILPVANPLRSLAKKEEYIIVGNPDLSQDKNYCWNDLPFAKSEAEYVASQFKNSTLFTGSEASFHNVYNALKQKQRSARYIYLATHGVSDSINPADGSFLALSQKHLTGASLRKLKFHNNPLVVLSACQTGLGKVFPGGMFGLAQAWYYAGAQKTVMTLWNVSDEATATLMKIFNRNLASRNSGQVEVSSAEFALGDAIRQFKKDNPDPVYWAGISIYGTPSK